MPSEKKHSSTSRPADAIKTLQLVLADRRIEYAHANVSIDLADLHRPFPEDESFANAVLAVAREIAVALRDPASYGKQLEGTLKNLRRGAFGPLGSNDACLRLVVEPTTDAGMRIIAFRHRHQTPRPYSVVGERLFKRRP